MGYRNILVDPLPVPDGMTIKPSIFYNIHTRWYQQLMDMTHNTGEEEAKMKKLGHDILRLERAAIGGSNSADRIDLILYIESTGSVHTIKQALGDVCKFDELSPIDLPDGELEPTMKMMGRMLLPDYDRSNFGPVIRSHSI